MIRPAALLLALASCASQAQPANGPLPAGSAQFTADLRGEPIQVFTYRPADCTVTGVLVVLHGLDRNAGPYRDDAIPLAQRACMLVVAPLFDTARFPTWRYQRGGVVHDGQIQPAAQWTTAFIPDLVEWARTKAGRPELPYALIGHSAGAQFLSRVAAYQPGGATAFIIANPSTWVRARLDVAAAYGFGGAFPPPQDEAALRRYLALPITVLLGGDDTGSRNLADNEEAEEQGSTRLARGQTVYAEAQQTARQHNWPFNWRIAVVPGVGHTARRMFTSDAAFAALRP